MPTLIYTAAQFASESFPVVVVQDEFGSSTLEWNGPTAEDALASIGLTPEEVTITEIRLLWDFTADSSDSISVSAMNGLVDSGLVSAPQSYSGSTATLDAATGHDISISNNECDASVCNITLTLNSGTQIEVDYTLPVSEFWTGFVGAEELA